MNSPLVEDIQFLQHHGVKGMKWGVRNDKGHEGQRARTKKIARLDKKFERNAVSLSTAVKVHNRAAALTNKNDVDRINNKPKYKDKNFLKDSPLRRQYYKEQQDAFLKNLERAAGEMGTNASGTQKYSILEGDGGGWAVRTTSVKHASSDGDIKIKVNYDDTGRIVSIEVVDDSMAQTAVVVEDILEHHGVKGMKWGVRNKRPDEAARAKRFGPRGTGRIKGRSKKATLTGRAKRLNEEDLKKAIARMELEKKYVDLSRGTSGAGKKYTRDILENSGKTAVGAAVGGVSAHLIKKVLSKGSVTSG